MFLQSHPYFCLIFITNNEEGWKTPSSVFRFGFPKKWLVSSGGDLESGRTITRLGPGSPVLIVPLTHWWVTYSSSDLLAGPPSISLPTQREERLFFCFLALRRYSVSSNVKQCLLQNAWINSYLNRIIRSLISQHLVASKSSIVVKLKDTWLNLKRNQ